MWLKRQEEEIINEAAVITGACLRQLYKTTHTQTRSEFHSPFQNIDYLKCWQWMFINDTSFLFFFFSFSQRVRRVKTLHNLLNFRKTAIRALKRLNTGQFFLTSLNWSSRRGRRRKIWWRLSSLNASTFNVCSWLWKQIWGNLWKIIITTFNIASQRHAKNPEGLISNFLTFGNDISLKPNYQTFLCRCDRDDQSKSRATSVCWKVWRKCVRGGKKRS